MSTLQEVRKDIENFINPNYLMDYYYSYKQQQIEKEMYLSGCINNLSIRFVNNKLFTECVEVGKTPISKCDDLVFVGIFKNSDVIIQTNRG